MRRPLVLTAALGALVTALPAPASAAPAPAAAAVACSVVTDLPAQVSVRSRYVRVPVTLRGCAGVIGSATPPSAAIAKPPGPATTVSFRAGRTGYWDVYDFNTGPGTYRSTTTAYDAGGNWLPATQDAAAVKFATAGGMSATRSGSTVTLSGVAWRYDVGSTGMVRYPRATVTLQHRVPGTAYWSSLGTFRLDAAGRVVLRKAAPAVRDYRLVVPTGASFWGSASPAARR
jgi:hypothetical protein